MKTGWEVRPLGELCDVLDSMRKPVTKRDRAAGEIPYYGATGIQDYVADFLFDEPLVLVGEDGAKWGAGENTAFAVSGKCWVNNHAHVLRPHRKTILDSWLIYYLNATDLTEYVSGLTVPKLNQGNLRQIPITVPPISEQRRIVAILDEAFEGIAAAKANAERNLRNARTILETERNRALSEQNSTWANLPVSRLCRLINGRAYKKEELLDSGPYRVLRVGNFFTNTQWYYSDLELEAEKYCQTGDLLYAWSASFGPRIWDGERAIFHYHIWRVIPEEVLVRKQFLYHLLAWDVDKIKSAHGTGTTMIHVSKGSMEARELPVPSLADQDRLVGVFDNLAAKSQLLEAAATRKLAALDELKASLLHQAFTGQL